MDSNCKSFPDFDYYVSAFISAARSVTWIMKSEYKEKAGWEEWYKSRKPRNVDDEFLKAMNELRVRSVKTTPVQTNIRVTLDIPPEEVTPQLREYFESLKPGQIAQFVLGKKEDVKDGLLENREVLAFGETVNTTMYVDGFPQHDVREMGHSYLDELDGLLHECEARFAL